MKRCCNVTWEIEFLGRQKQRFAAQLEGLTTGRADLEALASVIDRLIDEPTARTGYAADAALTIAAALHGGAM